jgi:AraC-like DNA-binding protein
MPAPRVDPVRGLLNVDFSDGRVKLGRYVPSAPVDALVEHYWIVRWDLPPGELFTAENLPYPSVHIVLEADGNSRVQGVTTGKFTQPLFDRGRVFGIKFKPGGFRPLIDQSVSSLTNRRVPLTLVPFGEALERVVLPLPEDAEMVAACEAILAGEMPAPDPQVALLTRICDEIGADRSIVRVDQLLPLVGLRKRSVERLFREYVGVSPKWVIQRYRLFEAADRLRAGEQGAPLAVELGYFDQAHFIRDFKRLVGHSPQAFARSR